MGSLSNRQGTNPLNPRPYLCALLALQQLVFACAAFAQQPSAAAPVAAGGIKILILEGQHATNSVRGAAAVPPVVEVRDENDLPIEGATVAFQLPQSGPGGYFPGQKLTLEVKTDFRGQAGATGFVPNNKEGAFQIHITATEGGRTADAVISQTNSPTTLSMASKTKKSFWRNKYVLIGGGVVVAVTLAVVLTRSSPKNPTVTITPGPVTVNQ
jgi:hypothetical protein